MTLMILGVAGVVIANVLAFSGRPFAGILIGSASIITVAVGAISAGVLQYFQIG